jgi:hypothetical protein
MRVVGKLSKRNLPHAQNPETSGEEHPTKRALLTLRSAVILGSSAMLAIAAATLTYLSGLSGDSHSGVPATAIGAGVAAFAAAIKLLDEIIAG